MIYITIINRYVIIDIFINKILKSYKKGKTTIFMETISYEYINILKKHPYLVNTNVFNYI